jgi:hypothetical protein
LLLTREGVQVVEPDGVAAVKFPAVALLQGALLRGKISPRRIIHQVELKSRVRLAVTHPVEAPQGLQAFLKDSRAPEAVHQVFLEIGQGADQFHPSRKNRQMLLPGSKEVGVAAPEVDVAGRAPDIRNGD